MIKQQVIIQTRFDKARTNLESYVNKEAKFLLEYYRIVGINPTPNAPSTWNELTEHYKNDVILRGKPFDVYDGGSDSTIYPSKEGNYNFRFVHDMHHLILHADFSKQGGIMASEYFIEGVESIFGKGSDEAILAYIDTVGQLEHFHSEGGFVEDQYRFALFRFTKELLFRGEV